MTEQTEIAKKVRALDVRWGRGVIQVKGWTGIPNLLLERQQRLNIDAIKLNILLVLLKHWWEKDNMPFPSKSKIGEIIGRDPSTVQRHIREMEKEGLLVRNSRYYKAGGQSSNEYDLTGLLTALAGLAKEEVEDQKKQKEAEGRKLRGHTGEIKNDTPQ